jgi:predicted nucleic acid-binding protein
VLEVLSAIAPFSGLQPFDARSDGAAAAPAGRSGQEFADAYIAASVPESGVEEIGTFNRRHFERLGMALQGF